MEDGDERSRSATSYWPGRAADVALGLCFLAWSVLGVALAEPADRLAPARLVLCALQLAVGLLLLLRRELDSPARPAEVLAALPSLLASGAAVRLAHPLGDWPLAAELLFAAGGAGAILSLSSLGRCFAILPGTRGVVARGPYRLVRHPAYLCELVMVGGCALAVGLPWGPALLVVVAGLVVVRIHAEERALRRLAEYLEYEKRVRYRLLPLLW